MIYRCKGCGAALVYSIEFGKMECEHCGNTYAVEEVSSTQEQVEDQNYVNDSEVKIARKQAVISMQIMKCTSCGAELAVNGVETSTFCAYCGQATVVKDRMQDVLMPDYIIPFRKTRDYAKCVIEAMLSNNPFVPDGIKHFKAEEIRGIYVPFWLFDAHYHGKQYYIYPIKNNFHRYEFIEGETFFRRMTVDASRMLNNDSSSRLEPYDLTKLEKFNDAYLAGFYSDRFDIGTDASTHYAEKKALSLFSEAAQKQLHNQGARLSQWDGETEVTNTGYALLPVWFLTFRHDNTPYTMMVNGQTGKVVGAVPFKKSKFSLSFMKLSILLCPILGFLFYWLFRTASVAPVVAGVLLFFCFVIMLVLVTEGLHRYKLMMQSVELTTSARNSKYVKGRQG